MLRRGWIVERLLACIDRNRRLAEAFEISITTADARVTTASVEGIPRHRREDKTIMRSEFGL